MTTKQDVHDETITITLNQVMLRDDQNVRTDLPDIEELAASIKDRGLLQPIVVRNGGTKDQPYKLAMGRRRYAAMKLLKKLGEPIEVKLRKYAKGDYLSRMADNWLENSQRVNVSPFDQAERIHELLMGKYAVDTEDGEVAVPVSKKDIEARLHISAEQVGKLDKIYTQFDPDAAKLAKKIKAPMNLLVTVSRVEGSSQIEEIKNPKDDAEKAKEEKREQQILESRAKHQLKLLNDWDEKQKALAASGRKRDVRSDKGAKKGAKGKGGKVTEVEMKPAVSPTKVLEPARVNAQGEKIAPRRTSEQYRALLEAKKENEKDKLEIARLNGMLDAFKFLNGEVKSLKGIKKSDWKLLDPADEGEGDDE